MAPSPAKPEGEAPTGSLAYTGTLYPIPDDAQRNADFAILQERVHRARSAGMEVVAIQGLGFVGAAMALVVAHASHAPGQPRYFVIGIDLPTPEAYWKIGLINDGVSPVVASDPKLAEYARQAVAETRNLMATSDARALSLADVIVMDVHLDVTMGDGVPTAGGVELATVVTAARTLGQHARPDALIIVETTVPPGTTSRLLTPTIRDAFRARGIPDEPLVAHSYERVMPGAQYLASIEAFWRSYGADTAEAARRTGTFLETIIDTRQFPLRRLESAVASELGKVLENSYRAANIAFIYEWTLAAEAIGVNLFEVIDSVAVRRGTHDNIRRPGLGVGGYCLTKDPYLAQWGLAELLGCDVPLTTSMNALRVNAAMPQHAVDLLRRYMGNLSGRTVLVAGISYLNEVSDTRHSPTERLCGLLESAGASAIVHDPYVSHWRERPDIANRTLAAGVGAADAVVLGVRHREFLALDPAHLCGPAVRHVLDTQDILTDDKAAHLYARGIQPVGVGKGHWNTRFPRRSPS